MPQKSNFFTNRTPGLTLVSCGVEPEQLPPTHRQAIASAEILAGGRRLLSWFPDFDGKRIVLAAHASQTAGQLCRLAKTRRVTVLASGDSLFFGIGRFFAGQLPPEKLRILPHTTAAQHAFAALAMPWHDARFFSVHGRNAPLPWREILRAPLAAVYSDNHRTPAKIAAELIQRHPPAANRPAAIAANLGEKQKIFTGTLRQLSRRNVTGLAMLILCPSGHGFPSLPLGLDDELYEKERDLITHPEVRSVVLAKLRLTPGVMWDLGAGSGSVGIEASLLCHGLAVCAVEQHPGRCRTIERNARRSGCVALQVVQGNALTQIKRLPAPDAVFAGGGGAKVAAIVKKAFQCLKPGGALVAAAVTLETQNLLSRIKGIVPAEIIELSVRRSRPLARATLLAPQNPITLFVYRKPF
ncbi:MAG: precorrin-6y C5,15-methyltransferase (decarboxylating) subunit CbiE [Verrucomicrobiae bacterium]|nr:precorrin-6y C5,15-methyltransferase (decarboxylating) subunit CbiE [Verrucomicrobiae bacterium]